MTKTLLLTVFLLAGLITANADTLFRNGHSDYDVVLSVNASVSERKAAEEFQQYIREVSGVVLPVSTKPTAAKHIFIGYDKGYMLSDAMMYADDDEGFSYFTSDGNLYICGGRERGTMYGVYAFLEQVVGVRWYTSSFTFVPKYKSLDLPKLNHSERPTFQYREDFYYDAIRHNEWLAHNRLNSQYQAANTKYGKVLSYWGIHTFHRLLPPDKYFNKHPEYYSVNNGKRSRDAQLCLANEAMRRELTRNLLKEIEANPDCWCFDVSQNDNSLPCECKDCKRLIEQYGGESGIMLWFVNQVTREVRKTHPEVFIGTFAYRYTRTAPTSSICPEDNVVIRLCNIECCMAHSLDQCPRNKSFIDDLNAWKKISRNVFIWDYTTGFSSYLLPFPNMNALAANYKLFAKSNVIGILEEGSHNAQWSEFSEMKQWVIAKMLWNPEQSVDSLTTMFIKDYYGKSAPYVQKYYDLCKKQITDNCHFTIDITWENSLYSDDFISKAGKLLRKAASKASGDSLLSKRVSRLDAQIQYLIARRNTKNGRFKALKILKQITDSDPTIFREGLPSRERFFEEMEHVSAVEVLMGLAVTLLAADVVRRNVSFS